MNGYQVLTFAAVNVVIVGVYFLGYAAGAKFMLRKMLGTEADEKD